MYKKIISIFVANNMCLNPHTHTHNYVFIYVTHKFMSKQAKNRNSEIDSEHDSESQTTRENIT